MTLVYSHIPYSERNFDFGFVFLGVSFYSSRIRYQLTVQMTMESKVLSPTTVKYSIESILGKPDKKVQDFPDDVEIMRRSPQIICKYYPGDMECNIAWPLSSYHTERLYLLGDMRIYCIAVVIYSYSMYIYWAILYYTCAC